MHLYKFAALRKSFCSSLHRKNFFLFLSFLWYVSLILWMIMIYTFAIVEKSNERKESDPSKKWRKYHVANRKEDRNSHISLLSLFERAEKLISNVRTVSMVIENRQELPMIYRRVNVINMRRLIVSWIWQTVW